MALLTTSVEAASIQQGLPALKSYHEMSPLVVLYSGDAMRASVGGDLMYTYHLNGTVWFGCEFMYNRTRINQDSPLRVRNDKSQFGLLASFYLNIPILFGADAPPSDRLHADIYTSFGLGHLWIDREREPAGLVGGGLLLQLPIKYLALRFDLKSLFFVLNNGGGSRFNADMLLNLGPSLKF